MTAATAAATAILSFLCTASPAVAALTEAPRLSAIYDSILAAQFEQAHAKLVEACPPAPEGACRALAAVANWWQISLDPESHLLDQRFIDTATAAIATNEEWTRREPGRAEAWFYLAGSYAPYAQWRVLRGERLAAARDGKRIKEALERALALDPTVKDAYFGIGLYHYYADVAPAAAKILRFLLLLPGGDRAQGLREMLEAREHGELLRGEADYQLHLIYLWYEHDTVAALRLLEALDDRYRSNPLFLERIAQVRTEYQHDHPAAAAAWQRLLERASAGEVARSAETTARLGLAAELDAMYETDRAIDILETVVASRPVTPHGALSRAQAMLAADRERLGIGTKPQSAAGARASDAYRTSLAAWRAFERRAYDEAEPAFTRAKALAPADPVLAYRYGRFLEARGDHALARAEFEQVIAARPVAPPFVLAAAYVECARLVDRSGDHARAIALYEAATTIAGSEPADRDRARRALQRLRSSNRAK